MGKFLIIPDWTTLLPSDHKNCVNRFVYLLTKELFPNFKVTEKFSIHKFWQTLWVPYLWTNSPLLMDTTGCRGPWMSGTHHGLCPPSYAFCSCHILPSFFTQVIIIIHLFYCMYLCVVPVCGRSHVCAYVHPCVFIYVSRPKFDVRCLFWLLIPFYIKAGSLTWTQSLLILSI